ncbi:L-threonylcarbamoyladenylate synthase [Candidatus Methanoperedens sp. BLZ2]|uniref:L-threonylcarbamoyladenylate synthase n=1 Tax=Candidatus Methanoperedens sp. BLZ2 TaxID=2035255 RepID=UPI0020D03E0F|nr:L-threonylcarbamoyladenylate synthase [Candidatus Methanoperedens sp. BLZ2]
MQILDSNEIRKAANILKTGGIVAFPTETVYGLGANAYDQQAVTKIFKAKNRPDDNPLISYVSSYEMLYTITNDIPAIAAKLMKDFWPGPLTLKLKSREDVPVTITGGSDMVAVRMPDHEIALALINEVGVPIVASSANISGRPSPTMTKHVTNDLDGKIDAIIRGDDCKIGIESTIVDLTVTPPAVRRPGAICIEEIIESVGAIAVEGELVNSPGMRYRHFSPQTPLTLVEGERTRVLVKINHLIQNYQKQGLKVGVLACHESSEDIYCDEKYILGSINDLKEVARRLYSGLRFLDDMKVDVGIAEGTFPEEREGKVIMNRLRRAAEERFSC